MKKHVLPLAVAALFLLACTCTSLTVPFLPVTPTPRQPVESLPPTEQSSVPPAVIPLDEAPFTTTWDDRSLFRGNLVASRQSVLEGLPGASVYHLALNINSDLTHITGVEQVYYTNCEDTALDQVDLSLFPEILGGKIEIDSVSVDGQPELPHINRWYMAVPLSTPLQPGQSIVLQIDFRVTVPSQGGDYYYGIFGYNEGILSLAHAYPTVLVYNQQGWNNENPDTDGDPLFADASFYLVSVDAPADLVLVAAGHEVDRQEAAGRQWVLYADGPARDFYLAASPDFAVQSETDGEITINSYGLPGSEQAITTALVSAKNAIRIFSQRYAAYPYTEFDIVPISTDAGGVEYPGMTATALDLYPSDLDYLEEVVAHEVGHQWFYNLVGNDTQDQPWLDESLVQFITCAYYRDRYGAASETSCSASLQDTWDYSNDPNLPIGLPVSDYSSSDYVGIIYGRGAFFFEALEERMGKATFDQFMRDYTATYSWEVASTEGLKVLAEQECGCDMTALFEEWVYPK